MKLFERVRRTLGNACRQILDIGPPGRLETMWMWWTDFKMMQLPNGESLMMMIAATADDATRQEEKEDTSQKYST